MEYISVKEAAAKWGVTCRMVKYYCVNGRIKGTQKIVTNNSPSTHYVLDQNLIDNSDKVTKESCPLKSWPISYLRYNVS